MSTLLADSSARYLLLHLFDPLLATAWSSIERKASRVSSRAMVMSNARIDQCLFIFDDRAIAGRCMSMEELRASVDRRKALRVDTQSGRLEPGESHVLFSRTERDSSVGRRIGDVCCGTILGCRK